MSEPTDAHLVHATLAGDLDAFGTLVRRYQNAYFRFAVRMLGNRDDADDALQSAFVRAYRALASCREPARFAAWLYHIVANECLTLAQRRDARERRLVRDVADEVVVGVSEPVIPGDDVTDIERALQRLDPPLRAAFLLKHVEELSYEEMSELTGASVSALKMRVKRARDRLQEILEPARSMT